MVERYMWLFSRLLKKRASSLILDTSIVLRLQISFVKALAHHVKRLSKDSLFVSAKTGWNRDASVKISILKKYISPLSLDVWSVWSAQMELEVRHRCDGGDYWLHSLPHIIVLPPVLWLPQLFPCLFHMHTLHTRHAVMCPSLSNHQPQLPTRTLCVCVCVGEGQSLFQCVLLRLSIASSLIISPSHRLGHQLLRVAIIWDWFSPSPSTPHTGARPRTHTHTHVRPQNRKMARQNANDKGLTASEAPQCCK